MSDKLPFEESLRDRLNDLPVPDMEQSWQQMKEMLDSEEDRKRPFLFYLRSCLGWGALLVLLCTTGYFLFSGETNDKPAADVPAGQGQAIQQPNATEKATTTAATTTTTPTIPPHTEKQTESVPTIASLTTSTKVANRPEKSRPLQHKNGNKERSHRTTNNDGEASTDGGNTLRNNEDAKEIAASETNEEEMPLVTESATPVQQAGEAITDTASQKKAVIADSIVPNPESEKTNKTRKFYITGGLGLQQQIPIAGQASVPYDYYGRKTSFADYVPSVFFRLHKERKWFVMGEFRFGAPQNLEGLEYSKQTRFDTAAMMLRTTTMRIKKTYYHQLPVSFNYYITRGWSVGIGGMYSRFHGAVTEEELRSVNVLTQEEMVSRKVRNVTSYTDSFFYRTQVHALFQTDYQWKNLIVGLRFSKDLQPYIRYTRPDGSIDAERSFSFQAIIRYQLFSLPRRKGN